MQELQKKKKQAGAKVVRYKLLPYSGSSTRDTCPRCRNKHQFAPYIDVTTGIKLGDDFGCCNRATKCGYHKSPYGTDIQDQSLFVDQTAVKNEFLADDTTISTINKSFVLQSLGNYDNNMFVKYLMTKFPADVVMKIVQRYQIGTSDKWDGACIFWQLDHEWDVRTGKIMLYDNTCKRVKEPYPHISWVHHELGYKLDKENPEPSFCPDYNLTQCFFGEHLITDEVDTYHIVESEKTAAVCSMKNPSTIWLATGGLNNINKYRLRLLQGKKLIFYPDKGKAFAAWEEKLKWFKNSHDITLSRFLEDKPTVKEGHDMADYILQTIK